MLLKLRSIGGCGGENPGQLQYPAGVYFVNNNEILISDQCNHRIQHINIQTGTGLKSFGKLGAGKGELRKPLHVVLDDEGRIVVTECGNDRIQVLSQGGETILIFGDRGPEKLNKPTSCIPHKTCFSYLIETITILKFSIRQELTCTSLEKRGLKTDNLTGRVVCF